MQKTPKEFQDFPIDRFDRLPETADVASATECTGLMPALPKEAGESEAYRSLHSTALPKEAGHASAAPAMEAQGQPSRRKRRGKSALSPRRDKLPPS